MAELVVCPGCKKQLQVPEAQMGKRVECPECHQTFVAASTSMSEGPIPSKSSQPPTSSDDEEPRRRRRRRFDDDDDGDDRDDLNVRHPGDVPNYLAQAILVTICCCVPLGIVAIVHAAKVNTALARGDYEGAVRASEDAKKWCIIAFVLGIIVNGLWFGIQFAANQQF